MNKGMNIIKPFTNKIIKQQEDGISIVNQLTFFVPMALTSILIIITHSLFNAGLARLPSPEVYISAFAVSKSLMHLIQSPVMMVRQTFTALVDDQKSYLKVRNFIIGLISLLVLLLTVIAYTDLARWIFKNLMGISGDVLEKSIIILRVLVIFPIGAALRNVMQGLSIKFNLTPLFPLATSVRIIYVTLIVVFIEQITLYISPGVIAGLMFFGAILIEGIVLFIGNHIQKGNFTKAIDKINTVITNNTNISTKFIFTFFWPLVTTSLIHTLAVPIVNTGLARTIRPELAISAYAVAWGLGLIILSPIFMFHQVPINFIDETEKSKNQVKKFGIYLGIFVTVTFATIAFTDISYYILNNWIGTNEEISSLAVDVLKIMSLFPFIVVVREYYWGYFIKNHMTKHLSKGKVVHLITLSIMMLILTTLNHSNPAIIGVIGIGSSDLAETLYLYLLSQKLKKNKEQKSN